MDILSQIIAQKRLRVDSAKAAVPIEELSEQAIDKRARTRSHALRDALNIPGINIIAEFKRRSPSRGMIRENANVTEIARSYQSAGAAAISVLTEENYFAGSLDDLRAARRTVTIPVLRKDFIVSEYQVYESAAAGADALLLIVAALEDDTLGKLLRLTETELRMDALVEVHTKEDINRAVALGSSLIGVNNRDLRTFAVSTETSLELAHFAPPDAILVSESGLSPSAVCRLHTVGYKGFLVGEALMRADDPGRELRVFAGNVHETTV
ncbi:MAG TPA: indole-3-glycerol phosphate synthase TrpC [Pyrinomonadaceae bacterium]|nr:indole-3-glycerol phosphate synthase TrpC [Pyrinomonadaceae bacterium]